ncbi:MAG: L-threonylcarbamoyladenylate synthase [Candidatus Bathyarchaeia archaeon]|nr:threonylcarbamoyl-AMP synthase [Candidatus Bathyarchaeota archaeon]
MKARILKYSREAVREGGLIIRRGGLVAFPTETVYGLGASAFNPNAVARIFEVKRRPRFDPIIVHIANPGEIERVCLKVGRYAKMLIERFWPGPLTLVLPKSDAVPDIVTAGLETVAVRMPSHPVALELIREAGVPVAAPSANLFGRLSPTTAMHVKEQIGGEIDLIIDGGRSPIGVESTVLDLTGEPTVLRPGGLPVEEIEEVIGKVKISPVSRVPRSPGQLPRHYSPRTPVRILRGGETETLEGVKAGLLAFKQLKTRPPFKVIKILSPKGDLREAAANLFSLLHELDEAGLDVIYAEPVPEIGLGRAIMDRLRKAEGIEETP